jgi:hypothetical protein
VAGTPEWLAEQIAIARAEGDAGEDDIIIARRHLRRRANILDWFQIAALTLGTIAIVTLSIAYFRVDSRANHLVRSNDRLVRSYTDLAKVADDLRRLAAAGTPEEREAARQQVQADAGLLTPPRAPAPRSGPAVTSTTTTVAPGPPTTQPTTTTTSTSSTTSTTAGPTCALVPVVGCIGRSQP